MYLCLYIYIYKYVCRQRWKQIHSFWSIHSICCPLPPPGSKRKEGAWEPLQLRAWPFVMLIRIWAELQDLHLKGNRALAPETNPWSWRREKERLMGSQSWEPELEGMEREGERKQRTLASCARYRDLRWNIELFDKGWSGTEILREKKAEWAEARRSHEALLRVIFWEATIRI